MLLELSANVYDTNDDPTLNKSPDLCVDRSRVTYAELSFAIGSFQDTPTRDVPISTTRCMSEGHLVISGGNVSTDSSENEHKKYQKQNNLYHCYYFFFAFDQYCLVRKGKKQQLISFFFL